MQTRLHGGSGRRIGPAKLLTLGLAVAMSSALPDIAAAQSTNERIQELERKLERSLKTIEELAARVRELEARKAPLAEPAPAAPQAEEHHDRRFPAAAGAAPTPPPPTLLRGFADVGANFFGNRGNKGFIEGSVDFYLTPQLTENIRAVMELVFEHDDAGVLSPDLERLQVGYTFSNALTVWGGRFHSPLGYWNTAFHHGQQLQTSVLRPRMIDFEDHGGVIPAHTVGVWASGAVHTTGGRLTYDLFGGNSPSINATLLNPNNSGKEHSGYGSGFNLGYLFGGAADGLKVGVHGYRAVVRDDAMDVNITRMSILGGYAALDSPVWEVIAEYYGFHNVDQSGGSGTHRSWAGFAQVGRRFARWTPFGRLEKAALNQADNYFAGLESGRAYRRQAVGLRYDLSSNTALKAELVHTAIESAPAVSFNALLTQWAIRF